MSNAAHGRYNRQRTNNNYELNQNGNRQRSGNVVRDRYNHKWPDDNSNIRIDQRGNAYLSEENIADFDKQLNDSDEFGNSNYNSRSSTQEKTANSIPYGGLSDLFEEETPEIQTLEAEEDEEFNISNSHDGIPTNKMNREQKKKTKDIVKTKRKNQKKIKKRRK